MTANIHLAIQNRLSIIRVKGNDLEQIGAVLNSLETVDEFDYDDVAAMLHEAEVAIGQARKESVALRSLKVEMQMLEGEPVGRRRDEPA